MVAPAVLIATLLSTASFASQLPPPDDWARADEATTRLLPSAFPDLPEPVRLELLRRGCTIPQVFSGGPPHNVIRGTFRAAGQSDVAVLCSRERTSVILVFWSGDPTNASEIGAQADADYLQIVAPGQIGFSRAIASATPEYIVRHQQDGDPPLATVEHDGIIDMFVEKASVVWYHHERKWLRLSGSN
jgi:hypothetical protein